MVLPLKLLPSSNVQPDEVAFKVMLPPPVFTCAIFAIKTSPATTPVGLLIVSWFADIEISVVAVPLCVICAYPKLPNNKVNNIMQFFSTFLSNKCFITLGVL